MTAAPMTPKPTAGTAAPLSGSLVALGPVGVLEPPVLVAVPLPGKPPVPVPVAVGAPDGPEVAAAEVVAISEVAGCEECC